MRKLQRITLVALALVLTLLMAVPALATGKNETKQFSKSIVLVTYETEGLKRSATGVVVGDLASAKDCIILCSAWVIDSAATDVTVDVKLFGTGGTTYKANIARTLDANFAMVETTKFYDKVTPIALEANMNVVSNEEIRLVTTNKNAIMSYYGKFSFVEDGLGMVRAAFDKADIGKISVTDANNSMQYYSAPLYHKGIVGFATRVDVPNNDVLYYDGYDLMKLLAAHNYHYTFTGDTPSGSEGKTDGPTAEPQPDVTVDPNPVDPEPTTTLIPEPDPTPEGLSTGAIIAIIAGAVVLIGAIVALIVVNSRKKSQATNVPGGTVGVKPIDQSSFKLVCIAGDLKGHEYPLSKQCVIGRDAKMCQIRYPDSTAGVSGLHCRLNVAAGKVTLTDLNSTYGTLTGDGQKLTAHQSVALRKGDSFYLGSKNNGFTLQ